MPADDPDENWDTDPDVSGPSRNETPSVTQEEFDGFREALRTGYGYFNNK